MIIISKGDCLVAGLFFYLYDGATAADSGTLFNLKCCFNHRTVTANVTEHINQAYDLIDFSTKV